MFKYGPEDAIVMPINIRPVQTKGIRRDFVPGVRLLPYTGSLRDLMEQMDEKSPPQAQHVVDRSHVLLINCTTYLEGVRKRIQVVSGAVPKVAYEMIDPSSVARQCLVAAILSSRSRCAFASYYPLKRQGRDWRLCGCANHRLEETSLHVWGALQSTPLNLVNAKRFAVKLDRYYRAILWWTDRVGMALGYLWEGLCAPYPAQTYISLIALVDSLVGTRQSGGHALAERVATMLGTNRAERRRVYDEMVSLYKVRNSLVHGSAHPRKGKQTNLSLFMGAKRSNVSDEDLSSLISICVRLIKCCLEDKEYLSIVYTKGTENRTDKQLDTLFLYRLLGTS